jgi:hypothetical protein
MCRPPLDDAEVVTIAQHASTQADRPDFRPPEGVLESVSDPAPLTVEPYAFAAAFPDDHLRGARR